MTALAAVARQALALVRGGIAADMWRNSSKTVATSVEVQVVILLMNNELLVFLWNAPDHYDRVWLRLGCSILLLDILVYEVGLN